MTKQEQVAEMAEAVICAAIVSNAKIDDKVAINLKEFINNLYNAGYRKSEEVLKETAKEILQSVDYESNGQTISITNLLRKKYGIEVEE